jgi:Kef-type K+ transport system membrane component KefB
MLAFTASFTIAADVSPSPSATITQTVDSKGKLESALADFVMSLTNTAGQAKDFVVSQAPEFVKQLLAWAFYSDLFWAIIFAILTILLGRWAFRASPKRSENDDWVATVILTVFTIVFGLVVFGFLSEAIKITIAPQVYLLEYAKSMIK